MPKPLEDVQDELLDQIHAGDPVDRAAVLAAHPEHHDALEAFFTVIDLVEGGDDGPTPARLGEFRIVRELGRGGMGVVYEAEQPSLKRRVALKVLPPALRMDPRLATRFQREAEAAGRLRHPGIVPVFSVGDAAGTPFFVMELVAGSSLGAILEQRRAGEHAGLPTETDAWRRWSIQTVAQVADALAYAHAQGILHRDVKPGNILIDSDGTPRLTDFGLALDLRSPGLTRTGEVFGSPQYMSPEQAIRRETPVDERTDVYSLAVTLYELLTLKLPYSGSTQAELLTALASGRVLPPRKVDPSIPRPLEQVLMRALRMEPRERYRSASAFATDLRAVLEGSAPTRAPARRLVRNGPARTALATIGCVLILLGVWYGFLRPDDAPTVGNAPLVPVAGVPERSATSEAWRDGEPPGGWQQVKALPEGFTPVPTPSFYAQPIETRLALLWSRRTIPFWLDLKELREAPTPEESEQVLRSAIPDAAERTAILAEADRGREIAGRFCRDWNENWGGDDQKAAYDALRAELEGAGDAAVPYILAVLGVNPWDAFVGREDRGQVSARMQVRAIFAVTFLEIEQAIPFLLAHCVGPSLTAASNASLVLERLTGEDFDAEFLKSPELARIEWWTLGHRGQCVAVRAAARAMFADLERGIEREPGDEPDQWWGGVAVLIVQNLERVLGRRLPFDESEDLEQQRAQVRRLRNWYAENETALLGG